MHTDIYGHSNHEQMIQRGSDRKMKNETEKRVMCKRVLLLYLYKQIVMGCFVCYNSLRDTDYVNKLNLRFQLKQSEYSAYHTLNHMFVF